jgi:hypothetical protein
MSVTSHILSVQTNRAFANTLKNTIIRELSMEKCYMIIDLEGNVVSTGHPVCVEKRRQYWEEHGYKLEMTDKEEAVRRYQEYVKSRLDQDAFMCDPVKQIR